MTAPRHWQQQMTTYTETVRRRLRALEAVGQDLLALREIARRPRYKSSAHLDSVRASVPSSCDERQTAFGVYVLTPARV